MSEGCSLHWPSVAAKEYVVASNFPLQTCAKPGCQMLFWRILGENEVSGNDGFAQMFLHTCPPSHSSQSSSFLPLPPRRKVPLTAARESEWCVEILMPTELTPYPRSLADPGGGAIRPCPPSPSSLAIDVGPSPTKSCFLM